MGNPAVRVYKLGTVPASHNLEFVTSASLFSQLCGEKKVKTYGEKIVARVERIFGAK